jgi:phospholipase D1/2
MGIEELIFSHHQKTIICDENGFVVAYVGGLDLTSGRWDTPSHELFTTRYAEHVNDFYQNCVPAAKQNNIGPRQPWHDIHSKVEGMIALDLFDNFRQRWQKYSFNPNFNVENVSNFLFGKADPKTEIKNVAVELRDVKKYPTSTTGNWSCQILRSIDKYTIDLNGEGEAAIIRSIHNAYVMRIATAQNFVYLENQYFMGSSHFWHDVLVDPGLRNLIPYAITEKIVSKIQAKEPFVAYLIIPMFPEGEPASMGVQAMLRWQYNTFKMMYKRIADEIRLTGGSQLPTDYLVVMCLGNREKSKEFSSAEVGTHGTTAHRRHMIYVHSKMMIVDDEYILIGSANINDRSLRGNRDTEIAVICRQRPGFYDIHNFRLSLWAEHFGAVADVFRTPQLPQCVSHVRNIIEKNWNEYTSESWDSLTGHALPYPYSINEVTGEVGQRGDGKFPDFPLAEVLGKLQVLPYDVTT